MRGIGLDTGRYSPEDVAAADVARVRGGIGLGARDTLFLMIAEFTANKRHRDAILALERLGDPTCTWRSRGATDRPWR